MQARHTHKFLVVSLVRKQSICKIGKMRCVVASLSLILALVASENKISYDGYKVLKVSVDSQGKAELARVMEEHGYGKWGEVRNGAVELILQPGERERVVLDMLEREGMKHEVLAEDLGRLISKEKIKIQRRKLHYASLEKKIMQVDFDIFNFHQHDEINQYLYDLDGN